MQMQLKIKELELEQYRLSKEKEGTEPSVLPSVQNIFDVSKYYKIVLPFWRKTWTNLYVVHVEKIAKSLAWSNEYWTLLLQRFLIVKAREIYGFLGLEKS